MVMSWFDARDAIAFGEAWARDYDEACRALGKAAERKQDTRYRKALDGLLRRARAYRDANRPNVYKKAKLTNRIKWVLRDLGHDHDAVDLLVKEVLLALA